MGERAAGASAMFFDCVFPFRVRLHMREVGRNVRQVVEERARSLLEGVCSENGYVRPGTLRMIDMARGELTGADMCRYAGFDCRFRAEMYNPPPRTRHSAYVRSVNSFGALLEAGYWDDASGALVPVIEVVVVRDPTISNNEVAVEGLRPGDEVTVEIVSARFELRDTRLTGYGRLVRGLVPGASAGAAGAAGAPGATRQLGGARRPTPGSGGTVVGGDGEDEGAGDGYDGGEVPEGEVPEGEVAPEGGDEGDDEGDEAEEDEEGEEVGEEPEEVGEEPDGEGEGEETDGHEEDGGEGDGEGEGDPPEEYDGGGGEGGDDEGAAYI